MLVEEIIEGYKQVWGRNKKGLVRRYRCTDGPKKGRVVAKPSTCATGTSQSRSQTLKRTRRTKGKAQALKRSITMKRPTTKRIQSINRSVRPRNRNRGKK